MFHGDWRSCQIHNGMENAEATPVRKEIRLRLRNDIERDPCLCAVDCGTVSQILIAQAPADRTVGDSESVVAFAKNQIFDV
jgi:hypothetical protein